jgi:hypothetical protein
MGFVGSSIWPNLPEDYFSFLYTKLPQEHICLELEKPSGTPFAFISEI